MVGCILSQLKPSELYIFSCGKGRGLRPRPFPQLRMWSSSGFILYLMALYMFMFPQYLESRYNKYMRRMAAIIQIMTVVR